MQSPKVALLCGGLGMRIREVAGNRPKAMVDIGGRPLIWHIMRNYRAQGFNRFVLCLGYMGEEIRDYFLHYVHMTNDVTLALGRGAHGITIHPGTADCDGDVAEWEVTLVDTGQETMTGARLKRIEKYIDTPYFLCSYGDGLSNVDLRRLVAFHRDHRRVATVTAVMPASRFGTMQVSGDRVIQFAEKPPVSEPVNGGFFVFDRRVFAYLSEDPSCVLERAPFEALARDGEMVHFVHSGFWQCVDTPRDLQEVNEHWSAAVRNACPPAWFLSGAS